MKTTDVRVRSVQLYFIPVRTRVPLKFGAEVLTSVTCARVKMTVEQPRGGRVAVGWGETPLSVQWVWPSAVPYVERETALIELTRTLARTWANFSSQGHPMEVGHAFTENALPEVLREFNRTARSGLEPVPHLASLVCSSAFDLALHDAFGMAAGVPTYSTYNSEFMNADLSAYLTKSGLNGRSAANLFENVYPEDFLRPYASSRLPAWHLVGGMDPISPAELAPTDPDDGYPVLLDDWIRRDGLRCLKVKLRGDDAERDFQRLVAVGTIGVRSGVEWLSADFNCLVQEPEYVTEILDRLRDDHPRIFGMTLYVEQPFQYDLEKRMMDVHAISSRKPLFMDESAHDWRVVALGHELGWSGVALKTCKTQTGAILSLCWARAHGLGIMVQDLTNPMLAQITHIQLGYFAGTIKGVETNCMQFYPEASELEARVHPGLFSRAGGVVELSSCLGRPGFGFRVDEIDRVLPESDSQY